MPILGDFAVKYADSATRLGVPMNDLYQALVDTAENTVSIPLFAVTIETKDLTKRGFSLLIGTWV